MYKSPDRYLNPLSTATVTTVCPEPISLAICSAPATLSPVLVPAKMPSRRASSHAIRRPSVSLTPLDHRQRHPVLVRSGRVVVLELDEHLRGAVRDDPPEHDQR